MLPPPGGWMGWREARRYAVRLGLGREFLSHVHHGSVTSVLALSPATTS
jgi:hypothetical protein